MRFRWKMVLLLTAVSLVPLGAMVFNARQTLSSIGETLVRMSSLSLERSAKEQLTLFVDAAAQAVALERGFAEMTAVLQAAQLQKALFLNGAKQDLPALFMQEQGRESVIVPPGERAVDEHSLAQATAPGAAAGAGRSGEKLAPGAFEVFSELYEATRGFGLWQFVALDSGWHAYYPAPARGVPPGYDPRKQEWYGQVRHGLRMWSYPFVDPLSGRVVVCVAAPLFDGRGEACGVSGLVVPLDEVMGEFDPSEELLLDADIYLVMPDEARYAETGRWELLVLAAMGRETGGRVNWRTPLAQMHLASGDREAMARLAEEMLAGRESGARMPFEGRDCLWVFSPTGYTSSVLAVAPYDEILAPARKARRVIAETFARHADQARAIGLGVIGAALLAALVFSRCVTRPLERLAAAAHRLGEGEFDIDCEVDSRDEFGEVGRLFNDIAPRLKEQVRTKQSLALAREVQQGLLPDAAPQAEGLDVAGTSLYCEATGGDYIDYVERPDGALGVVVGDVSGHGVEAALLMTTARALLRQRLAVEADPGRALTRVNADLTRDVYATGRFMTLFYLEPAPAGEQSVFVRAGHDPAMVFDPSEGEFFELGAPGLPLGVQEDFAYTAGSAVLAKGQVVVVGTDGIWEARNPAGEMFGRERLRCVVRRGAGLSAAELVERVVAAVQDFTGESGFEDDVTLAVVRIV